MIRSREVFSPALEHALLANRVLTCLRMKPKDPAELHEALDGAIDFLRKMLQGKEVVSSMKVSDESYSNALAYGEGIRALTFSSSSADANADPVRFISLLENVARNLKDGKEVDPPRLEAFQKFFSTVRNLAIESEAKPFERVSF